MWLYGRCKTFGQTKVIILEGPSWLKCIFSITISPKFVSQCSNLCHIGKYLSFVIPYFKAYSPNILPSSVQVSNPQISSNHSNHLTASQLNHRYQADKHWGGYITLYVNQLRHQKGFLALSFSLTKLAKAICLLKDFISNLLCFWCVSTEQSKSQ